MTESAGSVKMVKVWREAALRCTKLLNNRRQLSLSGLRLPVNLGQVHILNLANNLLQELPEGLDAGSLANLRALILRRNCFCRLPQPLWALGQLDELALAHNCLGQLPATFGQLQGLRTLDLDHNRLTHFPPQLLQLGRLEELDFSSNWVRALPPEIPRLHSIKILWLSTLQLPCLPDTFCHLGALESLMLDNALHSLPPSFGDLGRLKMINLTIGAYVQSSGVFQPT
ncbi:hypothetical protein scyTo_0010826 [Scyliorhinus torazame]|uniref:Uncharacterized protein n=1 Tax=Scyliorhinus torazame TaxID=75743 RepID=A0A401PC02_SCYTO|nr:hypothetical protein [Scyliorhinus torazame]